ncbi:MAG: SUMF1/EgtB/PvdO family nonheme iron enzyme [Acidobacteriota bacterium]|nr:MAG: SUMF1/EgtB/PvdO family nonheme iron enzyme [Acidobacteriota bacterium]
MKLNPFRFLRIKRATLIALVVGMGLAAALIFFGFATVKRTSTNDYCESCHVHPQATESWKQGPHFKTPSGVVVNCVECHLPPEGVEHLVEKGKAGARDLYGFYFTDTSLIDWEEKSSLEAAMHFTYDDACSRCHVELFPRELNQKGVDAHLHYRKNKEELKCINCHLKTGHFHEEAEEQILPQEEVAEEVIEMAPLLAELPPNAFEDYTEEIPGLGVKFEMVAVKGGTFLMGSPEAEPGREPDEGPQRQVQLSDFWMGKFEVSWDEYDAYYSQTATVGKNEAGEMSDAITGPTPPYGSPDQGWGKRLRPAITMTHFAARKYCEWLSEVTGRTYRLQTEAEWEYAARAGNPAPFFFEQEAGTQSWFDSFTAKLFGGALVDEEVLGRYAWYRTNSKLRTYPGRSKEPNSLGIYNLLGNVKEFCYDFYAPDVLASYPEGQPAVDPKGPESGEERVVRGGSYRSEAVELRSAARDRSYHTQWLKTDPQNPKSVWWYSDSKEVGFRIVREYTQEEIEQAIE